MKLPANATPSATERKPWRMSYGMLGVLSVLVVFFTTLGAGYAWPGVYNVIFGALAAPLLDALVSRIWSRPKLFGQLAELLLVGGFAALLGLWATRPNPEKAFEHMFGLSVPEGVSNVTARRQWYDGQITVLRFNATGEAIATTVAGRRLEKEDWENKAWTVQDWQVRFYIASIADPRWRDPVTIHEPHVYKLSDSSAPTLESLDVVWDKVTGEAFAQHAR